MRARGLASQHVRLRVDRPVGTRVRACWLAGTRGMAFEFTAPSTTDARRRPPLPTVNRLCQWHPSIGMQPIGHGSQVSS